MGTPLKLIIAGGGTGGHLFPGIALAEAFLERSRNHRVLFVGTGRPLELRVLSDAGLPHRTITVEGLKGRGWRARTFALCKFPVGLLQSAAILHEYAPDIVIGVGGYSSGPLVMAARLFGIPAVIQEQNRLPGLANRLLSRFADRIYASFPDTVDYFRGFPHKIRYAGNPVRKEIRRARYGERPPEHPFRVLICGGSQGARAINRAVASSLSFLPSADRFHFIHQTGEGDEGDMVKKYAEAGAPCTVRPFFRDIAFQYQNAHLVICRAGATTVAEIAQVGRAALFIPYPYAADDHQRLNAAPLVRDGAGEMILEADLSGEGLARRLLYYETHRDALKAMSRRMASWGRMNPAARILDDCLELRAGSKRG